MTDSDAGVRGVRVARADDDAQVRELLSLLHRGESRSFCAGQVRQGARSFVAERHGQVVGFLLATFTDYGVNRYGMIEELVVDPQHRRQGIGRALLDHCLRWFVEVPVDVVFVSTNVEASDFYLEAGFQQCSGPWLFWTPRRGE